jgi:hypothetical protein
MTSIHPTETILSLLLGRLTRDEIEAILQDAFAGLLERRILVFVGC